MQAETILHPTPSMNVDGSSASVCKALSDIRGLFRPSLSQVEALLGNDWGQPLHVTSPSWLPQQFEFEACHFSDLTNESTYCAQIVVYYMWVAQNALTADWDTMGVAWVVCDSLWNASCASPQCRRAHRILEASSIDMFLARPLIVAQVCNLGNSH